MGAMQQAEPAVQQQLDAAEEEDVACGPMRIDELEVFSFTAV